MNKKRWLTPFLTFSHAILFGGGTEDFFIGGLEHAERFNMNGVAPVTVNQAAVSGDSAASMKKRTPAAEGKMNGDVPGIPAGGERWGTGTVSPELLSFHYWMDTSPPWQFRGFDARPKQALGTFDSADGAAQKCSEFEKALGGRVGQGPVGLGPDMLGRVKFRGVGWKEF